MTVKHHVTLNEFIARRLGDSSNPGALLMGMLRLSFGAASFHDFWRYWNPVYGYFLYYYCYKPLRRFLSAPLGVVATFFASGFFLHDLPFGWWIRALRTHSLPFPFVAVWFATMGLLVLLTDFLHLDWRAQPLAVRALLNGVCIALPFLLSFLLLAIS